MAHNTRKRTTSQGNRNVSDSNPVLSQLLNIKDKELKPEEISQLISACRNFNSALEKLKDAYQLLGKDGQFKKTLEMVLGPDPNGTADMLRSTAEALLEDSMATQSFTVIKSNHPVRIRKGAIPPENVIEELMEALEHGINLKRTQSVLENSELESNPLFNNVRRRATILSGVTKEERIMSRDKQTRPQTIHFATQGLSQNNQKFALQGRNQNVRFVKQSQTTSGGHPRLSLKPSIKPKPFSAVTKNADNNRGGITRSVPVPPPKPENIFVDPNDEDNNSSDDNTNFESGSDMGSLLFSIRDFDKGTLRKVGKQAEQLKAYFGSGGQSTQVGDTLRKVIDKRFTAVHGNDDNDTSSEYCESIDWEMEP